MNLALKWSRLILRATMLKLNSIDSDPTSDYNMAAATYDSYYLKYFGKKSLEMWEKLPVKEGQKVLDLACGTGFFSHLLANKVGEHGKVFAVDLSDAMLQCNKDKAAINGFSNITFKQCEAVSFLSKLSDNSIDGIVCAWGLRYIDHKRFFQEFDRVLKPGGFLGLIEERIGTFEKVTSIFREVILDHPDIMVKNIVEQCLPLGKDYLVETFCKNKFEVEEVWEDNMSIPFKNGTEIAKYVIGSGISAGVIDALDRELLPQFSETFISYADKESLPERGLTVKHDFCALVATKV